MLGRLLCWLGLHDYVETWRNQQGTTVYSVGGYCRRCPTGWQLDN